MAMRAAATAAAISANLRMGRGLRGLYSSFSSFPFDLPKATVDKAPPAEPSTNLFVSGLSKRTTTEGLRDAFAKFGEVVQAKVVTDRVNGYSKGFGFVKYASLEDAAAGIKGMDGQAVDRVGKKYLVPNFHKLYLRRQVVRENKTRNVLFEELIQNMFLDGWVIFAEYARPREPLPRVNNSPPQGQQWR
ncbi:RNA binding protein [Striga asiatica]|uniref:RNA binding protein n=1 Tax=Striga asiatica TaxID=4170 RepID=A0A5A7RHG8_STRAF|nr:RNA binding protein [Striga asiatica]